MPRPATERDRYLAITVLGVGFSWGFVALIALTLVPADRPAPIVVFSASLIAGLLAARRLTGEHIELGLVPVGGFGMGLAAVAAYLTSAWSLASTIMLGATGFAAAWFAFPLHALTRRSPAGERRDKRLAAAITAAVFIALAWWAHRALSITLGLTAPHIQGITGALALVVTAYVLTILPDFFVRFILWMLTHTVYRIHVVGGHHIPAHGPALIIANHISMIDPALVGASTYRFVRFLMFGPHFRLPWLYWIVSQLHAIPVTAGKRRDVAEAIERSRAALQAGHVVCIFVEGAVSRTGNLLPFKRGFEKILDGLDVPVIPAYLDRVWGSVFSYKGGRFFWKLPERFPRPVTVTFGAALPSTINALDSRLVLMELGAETMTRRRHSTDLLHVRFMRRARRRWWRFAMADSSGRSITYGRALVAATRISRELRARTESQAALGIMLPPSVDGALATIATLMAGRVPVHLDPGADPESLRTALHTAAIRTVITSRHAQPDFANSIADTTGIFIEDLGHDLSAWSRLTSAISTRLLPLRTLRRRFGGDDSVSSAATAAIVVTGGRTGPPKAVELSHANILANVDSLDQVFPTTTADRFLGVLPLANALGLTANIWFPLTHGCSVIFQQDPSDTVAAGALARRYCASILICTPQQSAAYVRDCTPEQFKHLRYAITGAGRLPASVSTEFETRFGVPLFEGYGCAEMSPVVSVNRPNFGEGRVLQVGNKHGSVGHPLPGVAAKIVDVGTWEGPVFGRPGLLLVKGPNLMTGYIGPVERTAETMHEGWYVTGDLATMDEDGFIFIDEANDANARRLLGLAR